MHTQGDPDRQSEESFTQLSRQSDPGLVAEFIQFLRYNKKWWLIPILVTIVLLTAMAFLAASPVAPFIYTLF